MTRECQVRFCEGLGVKFPGPTRQNIPNRQRHVCSAPESRRWARYIQDLQPAPWVGFSDSIPNFLRMNQAHRSASSSRQRIDHPPSGRSGGRCGHSRCSHSLSPPRAGEQGVCLPLIGPLACAALWRRRPDRAARSIRALCLSKFSKGVREFAQVIKKDAAISVGRSEFRGVLRGVSDRLSRATRRGLGCRYNQRSGDVGAPGCFLRRG